MNRSMSNDVSCDSAIMTENASPLVSLLSPAARRRRSSAALQQVPPPSPVLAVHHDMALAPLDAQTLADGFVAIPAGRKAPGHLRLSAAFSPMQSPHHSPRRRRISSSSCGSMSPRCSPPGSPRSRRASDPHVTPHTRRPSLVTTLSPVLRNDGDPLFDLCSTGALSMSPSFQHHAYQSTSLFMGSQGVDPEMMFVADSVTTAGSFAFARSMSLGAPPSSLSVSTNNGGLGVSFYEALPVAQ